MSLLACSMWALLGINVVRCCAVLCRVVLCYAGWVTDDTILPCPGTYGPHRPLFFVIPEDPQTTKAPERSQ